MDDKLVPIRVYSNCREHGNASKVFLFVCVRETDCVCVSVLIHIKYSSVHLYILISLSFFFVHKAALFPLTSHSHPDIWERHAEAISLTNSCLFIDS